MAVGPHNLARLAEDSFAKLGDRESLLFEGNWYRTGDMFERSRRLGAGFTELGIAPGDRAVVFMANSPDVGIAYNGLWRAGAAITPARSEEHTSELQSQSNLVCRLLLEKKKKNTSCHPLLTSNTTLRRSATSGL